MLWNTEIIVLFHKMNNAWDIMHNNTNRYVLYWWNIKDLHNSIICTKINLTLTYKTKTTKQFFATHSPRRNLKRNGIWVHQTCHECTNHDATNRTKHEFHLFNIILANCNCRGGIDARNACHGLFRWCISYVDKARETYCISIPV